MKKIFTLLCLTITTATVASAQSGDKIAEMKAWQMYMQPGDMQRMLAKSNGTWNTVTTLYNEASSSPEKSPGTCYNKMVMGGRYQESEFKGVFMKLPFEGQSMLGYDNVKKVFVSSWVDNMGTGIMNLTGRWDEAAKSIMLNGTTTDPVTGKDMPVNEVIAMPDNNHQTMDMFMNINGRLTKTMHIDFTRALNGKD